MRFFDSLLEIVYISQRPTFHPSVAYGDSSPPGEPEGSQKCRPGFPGQFRSLSKNPKPPLRGEVARRSRVGGVGAKSLEYVGNNVHFLTSNLPPLSRLRRQLPSRGA